jgi:hypothetical protein
MKTKEELLTQFENDIETLFNEDELEGLLNYVNTHNSDYPVVAKIYYDKEKQKFEVRYLRKNEYLRSLVHVVTIHGMADDDNYIDYNEFLEYLYEIMKYPIDDIFG